jgi:hypothetical protein
VDSAFVPNNSAGSDGLMVRAGREAKFQGAAIGEEVRAALVSD